MKWNRDEQWLSMRASGPLTWMVFQHQGWVRLFGWGVQWKSSLVKPVLFGERNDYMKWLHVGPWRLRLVRT